MDTTTYNALLAALSPTEATIMAAASGSKSITAPRLRAPTGRGDGMSKELRHLQRLGLLRQVGYEGEAHRRAMAYAIVPLDDVEEAAETFALRERETGKRRKRRASQTRITDFRRYAPGEFAVFAQVRTRTMQLTTLFSQIAKQAFWHAAPRDDLEMLARALAEHREELADHIERLEVAEEALRQRAEDDKLRDRIEKLLRPDGRTPKELEAFRAKAAKLRRKLPD